MEQFIVLLFINASTFVLRMKSTLLLAVSAKTDTSESMETVKDAHMV